VNNSFLANFKANQSLTKEEIHSANKVQGGGRAPEQSSQPNTIYSLQQAAGGYNSLSLNQPGATGHTLNAAVRSATLMVTREDFNIEDIHC